MCIRNPLSLVLVLLLSTTLLFFDVSRTRGQEPTTTYIRSGPSTQSAPRDLQRLNVRVGVVANESQLRKRQEWDYKRLAILSRLSSDEAGRNPNPIHFQIAFGGYNDVYYWAEHGLIDIGLFSPGVYAAILRDQGKNGFPIWEAIAMESKGGEHEMSSQSYHSWCVVPAASGIKEWKRSAGGGPDGLIEYANAQKLAFLFADPLSLSGCIAPLRELKRAGISWAPDVERLSEFTFSHDRPLKALCAWTPVSGQPIPVAFVRSQETLIDPATGQLTSIEKCPLLSVIRSPLNDISLPNAVLAVRHDSPLSGILRELLLRADPEQIGLVPLKEGVTTDDVSGPIKYSEMRAWLNSLGVGLQTPEVEPLSLNEVGNLLLDYAGAPGGEHPFDRPEMRIAVVLSGGGAKCAYQVGVVNAIEDHLAKLRARGSMVADPTKLDIALVVGTSGGALNAVPIAMGVTSSKGDGKLTRGQRDLEDIWTNLRTWDILQAWPGARLAVSAWFACANVFVLLGLWGLFCASLKALLVVCGVLRAVVRKLVHPSESPDRSRKQKRRIMDSVKNKLMPWPWFMFTCVAMGAVYFEIGAAKRLRVDVVDWVWLDGSFWTWAGVFTYSAGFLFFGVFGAFWRFQYEVDQGMPWFRKIKPLALRALPVWAMAAMPFVFPPSSGFALRFANGLLHSIVGGIQRSIYFSQATWLRLGPVLTAALIVAAAIVVFLGHILHVRSKTNTATIAEGEEAAPVGESMRFASLGRFFATAIVLLLVSGVSAWVVFGYEPSLIANDGIEQQLALRYWELVKHAREGAKISWKARSDTFAGVGDEITDPSDSMIKRDLILTASNIHRGRDVPSNFYFFYSKDASPTLPAPREDNWLSMRDESVQPHFMDLVLGSGAIFPLFPARRLESFYRSFGTVELIDGGFAHNTPLEAAISWGATHIFQIDAFPEAGRSKGGVLENMSVAYEHLYEQAQAGDLRARAATNAVVFAIRPRSTIGLLEFGRQSTIAAVAAGSADAVGGLNSRNFKRQPCRPVFTPVYPEAPGPVQPRGGAAH